MARVKWDHVVKMPYSERWRLHRRWLQAGLLTRTSLDSYRPLQREEVHAMLQDVLRAPENVVEYLTR